MNRRMNRRMSRKLIAFIVVTLALVCFVALCVGSTVRGQARDGIGEEEYRILEAQILKDTRKFLDRVGFVNSGVTLTRVVDGEGHREYTFTVHHSKIDRMAESERDELEEKLMQFCQRNKDGFCVETCSFRYKFLVLEN